MDALIVLSNMWSIIFANPIIANLSTFFFTPIQQQLVDLFTVSGSNVPSWISSVLGYIVNGFTFIIPSGTTIFGLMFTTGLTFFILFTIAKWVVAIIP